LGAFLEERRGHKEEGTFYLREEGRKDEWMCFHGVGGIHLREGAHLHGGRTLFMRDLMEEQGRNA
jgi:hypothetical protein